MQVQDDVKRELEANGGKAMAAEFSIKFTLAKLSTCARPEPETAALTDLPY
jgi:hypothetical protein